MVTIGKRRNISALRCFIFPTIIISTSDCLKVGGFSYRIHRIEPIHRRDSDFRTCGLWAHQASTAGTARGGLQHVRSSHHLTTQGSPRLMNSGSARFADVEWTVNVVLL